jgi:tight adherence protein C
MLTIALVAVFVCVALVSGLVAQQVVERSAPTARRLRGIAPTAAGLTGSLPLTETPDPTLSRLSRALPKSRRELGQLRQRLGTAGYYDMSAAIYFSAARMVLPVVLTPVAFLMFPSADAWPLALALGALGYVMPDLWLRRETARRAKAITNGLPDVLDLMIVCIEAGSALDQSITKATEELEMTHPEITEELRLITTEIRAGKPRMEAFQNFAHRTGVEEVRSLVTMLIQTDRFGTSIAKALRVHSETSRTKGRQRAEERAAKVGVKLVFPLVFCVFPAVYAVTIGPAAIAIYRAFLGAGAP